MAFFVITPAAATYLFASGIGTSIASFIGLGSISAATATAIGSATIGATFSALKGDKPEDILKNAVLGGITSYVGGTVGKSISQSVSKGVAESLISSGVSQSTASAMSQVLASATSGAITSGTSALLQGKNPIDAMLSGGLSAGLTSGVGLAVDKLVGSVPGFNDLSKTVEGGVLARATKSVIAASLLGNDPSKAIQSSLVDSFLKVNGPSIKSALSNAGDALQNSAYRIEKLQTQINENVDKQKQYAFSYDYQTTNLNNAASKANQAINLFNADKSERNYYDAKYAISIYEEYEAKYTKPKEQYGGLTQLQHLEKEFKAAQDTNTSLTDELNNVAAPELDKAVQDFNEAETNNTEIVAAGLAKYQDAYQQLTNAQSIEPTDAQMSDVMKNYGGDVDAYQKDFTFEKADQIKSDAETTYANEIKALNAGFPDYATYKQFYGDMRFYSKFPGYHPDRVAAIQNVKDNKEALIQKVEDNRDASLKIYESANELAAKAKGFPDYAKYQEFNGNADAYKASVWKPTDTTMAGGEQTAFLSPDNQKKLETLSSSDSDFWPRFNEIMESEFNRGDKGAFTSVGDGKYVQNTKEGVVQWSKDSDGNWESTILPSEEVDQDNLLPPVSEDQNQGFFDKYGSLFTSGSAPDSLDSVKKAIFGSGASSVGQDTGFAPVTGGEVTGSENPKTGIGPDFSLIAFDTTYNKKSALSWIETSVEKINSDPNATEEDKKVANELLQAVKDAPVDENPINFDNTGTVLAINENGIALVQDNTTGSQSIVQTIGEPEIGSEVDLNVSAATGETTAVAKTEQPAFEIPPIAPPVAPPVVTPPVVEPVTETPIPELAQPPVITPPEVVPPVVAPPDEVIAPVVDPEVVPPVVTPTEVTPPVVQPPVAPPEVVPPVVEPTVTPPPVVPPVVTPPVVEPPVVTPPVTPPVVAPPVVAPPVVAPPVVAPPVVAPPVTPPVVTPPVTPPVVAPPVAPAIGGVTIDAVTKAINDSIAGIQFPAGITPADVAEQIKSAMEANPNLKPEDVTKAITDYMSANPALTAADVNTAITGATKNLATQSQLDDAVKNLSADQKTQFNNLTQAQKDEVDARVKQGQDIQNAIASSQQTTSNQVQNIQGELNGRIDALVKQGVETNAAIQQAIAESQTQINRNDANINSRIDVLVGQGVDYQKATQIAFEETRGTINNVGKQLADKIKADEADKQAAAEAKRVADAAAEEEKKAAAAAALAKDIAAKQAAGRASTQAQQRAAGQGALSLLQPAATSELAAVAGPLAAKYLMAKEDPNKFESPLEKFLKTQNQSLGKENQYGIQPQGNVMNDPSYSYGTQRPIEDILGMGSAQSTQAGQAPDSSIPSYPAALPYAQGGMAGTRHGKYAQGGLSTPLMASGGKMRVDFRHGDAVTGAGDGQSDDIPAMLADGEFVFPADVVAAIGNGSTKAGSDKLYDMMHGIRAHARSAKPEDLPPQIKSPLDFLKRTA